MRTLFLLLASIAILLTGCTRRSTVAGTSPHQLIGHRLYAQQTFQYEKGRYRTTNYRRGILVPVNTPVEIEDLKGQSATLVLPDGGRIVVENIEKHTGASIEEVLGKMLSKKEVDLKAFTPLERKHIGEGTVAPGMSKKAVVTAIGFPPKHETPTSKMDTWRYWSSKFGTFVVTFAGDKVQSIRD